MAKLVCITGMNKGDEFPLGEGETIIGRDRSCDVILFDKKCSRRHCRIIKKGRYYSIEDLGSRNGTFVNRKRITKPRSIREGDRIHIGSTTLTLSEKPLGDLVDQTATEVAAELSEKKFEKVFDSSAAQAVRTYASVQKDLEKKRSFFQHLLDCFRRKK